MVAVESNKKPTLETFINRNNDVLSEFLNIYHLDKKGDSGALGTSIPFVYNLLGSFLINPSTVSLDTFQRMSYTDSIISSSLEYNTSIISNTVGDYFHKNKKIEKFVRKCFTEIKGGKSGLIRDMLTAMWAGFYTGEKVYSKPSEYIDGKIWVKSVLPYPPSTVLFRVDREGQLDDYIYQYVYFATNPGIQNSLSYLGAGPLEGAGQGGCGYPNSSPDGISFMGDFVFPIRSTNLQTVGLVPVPRNKIIHFTRKGQDGFLNPYGRSMLRSAYNFYVLKCAFLQFLAVAGDKKSLPILVAYVDPTALTTSAFSNPMNPDPILNNPQQTQLAIDTVRQALQALRGDSALILPGMKGSAYDLEAIHSEGNLDIFINALKYCDDSMQQSLFIPSSMFGNTSGASYALGTSQTTMQNKMLSSTRNSTEDTLIDDYVSDLITMNFSPDEYENYELKFGYFESELMNTEDKIQVAKLYETMKNSGLTSPSIIEDINKYRQKLGDSELTDAEIKLIQKDIEKQNQPKGKDTSTKVDVKSHDKHYKKRNDVPQGGSST
jgi:hypothetical protein